LIIVMSQTATGEDIEKVRQKIEELGYSSDLSMGMERSVIGLIGDEWRSGIIRTLQSMKGIEEIIPLLKPIRHVSREFKQENTVINIEDVAIGGNKIVVMAGPYAVERKDQLLLTSYFIKEAGARIIRGGAFRTRTFPDDFPGLGLEGLEILKEAKRETGLLMLTEVRSPEEVEQVDNYADIFQVGARYMQNYDLLSAVAEREKPILLKRGFMSSLKELLLSAEYIVRRNNSRVMLCERGIRTFENFTSYTLDLSSVPILKQMTHLPIIVDPSNGTGNARYVSAMARAAVAAGADGLLIEVHPNPPLALSHGLQALEPQEFKELMLELGRVALAVDRTI